MAKRDFYEVLGVNKSATAEDLKKAYRKAAMQYHPDRAKGEAEKASYEAKFKEINEAYDVLKDPQKKSAYDQYGHAAFEPGAGFGSGAGAGGFGGNPFGGAGGFGFDFSGASGGFASEDIFDMFFGGQRGGRGRQTANAGRDLHYQIQITFDKAVHGGEERIQYEHLIACATCKGSGSAKGSDPVTCDRCNGAGEIQQASRSIFGQFTTLSVCPKCQGEGKMIKDPCQMCAGKGRVGQQEELIINVPVGVDNGTELRFSGKGDVGARGGRAGDLYIEFRINPHAYFKRRGNDVYVNLPLTLSQAALGAHIEVPTVDGKTTVKVPAGVNHGTEIRLSGKGVQRLGGSGKGDQFLVVDLQVPKKVSGEEKKILEELERKEPKPKMPWG
jgi:molecular chaperone DnaJ